MRRHSKDSPKLSAESQRLISISNAIVQAASRVEERTWERNLDTQLQKLLKTNHQDSIDAALNVLFKGDLAVYDVLMDGVEAVSESSTMTEQAKDGTRVDGEIHPAQSGGFAKALDQTLGPDRVIHRLSCPLGSVSSA